MTQLSYLERDMAVSGDGCQILEAEITPINIPRSSGEKESTMDPLSIQQIFSIRFLNSLTTDSMRSDMEC